MLDQTKVTDAGLPHLKALTSLRTLDLSLTAVTAEGIATLEASSPQVSVKHTAPQKQ